MIPIYRYGETPEEVLFARDSGTAHVEEAVAAILDRVAREGDNALFDYARQFDHAELEALEAALRAQAAFVARVARQAVSSGEAAQAATQAAQAAFVAALREEEAR